MAWPKFVDLSNHRVMLDVGGGSGAHSLGAVTAWPGLDAVILDQQIMRDIAHPFIEKYGFSDRISTTLRTFLKNLSALGPALFTG